MSVRVSTTLTLLAGLDGKLDNKIFGGPLLSELLDTLAHAQSATYQLEASESSAIDLGDVAQVRLCYLEGDGEFSVVFGGGAATAALLDGVGASYPTTFAGGESLLFAVDGVSIAALFESADQTLAQVVARINFAASLAGFVSSPVAFVSGGQLRLRSPTTGLSSVVDVTGGTGRAALGLAISRVVGAEAVPGTSPVSVFRPADPSSASESFGVKSYLLATVRASAITVSNLSPGLLNLKVFVAGDLVEVAC